MKKILLAALAAVMLAGPASATTFTVKNSGSGGASFPSVNDSVRAGDVVNVNAGTYSSGPQPTVNGTSTDPITYIGDVTTPGNVIVTMPGDINRDYVVLKGFRTTGSITFYRHPAFGTPLTGSRIEKCTLDGGVDILRSTGCAVRNSTLGSFAKDACSVHIQGFEVYEPCTADTVEDNVFRLTANTTDSQSYTIIIKGNLAGTHARDHVIRRNTGVMTFRSPVNCAFAPIGIQMVAASYNKIYDNNWTIYDSTTTANCPSRGAGHIAVQIRDMSEYNDWQRDTITVTGRGGQAALRLDLTNSGCCGTPFGNNTYTGCVFKNLTFTGGNWPGINFQGGLKNDTFTRTVFQSRTNGINIGVVNGTVTFDHCAFADSTFGGAALGVTTIGSGSQLILNDNIFYPAGTQTVGGAGLYVTTTLTGIWSGSKNLFSDYYGTSGENSIHEFNSVTGVNTWKKPGSYGIYGSPRWVDSTVVAFNYALGAGSAALAAGTGGSNIGPWATAPGDSVRPAAINNLSAQATDNTTVLLVWTSVGDDSLTGLADQNELKYSTDPITAGNYDALPVFARSAAKAGFPRPQTPGAVQTYVVGGLGRNTVYYFAMKTADEVPFWSAISNIASIRTQNTGQSGVQSLDDP